MMCIKKCWNIWPIYLVVLVIVVTIVLVLFVTISIRFPQGVIPSNELLKRARAEGGTVHIEQELVLDVSPPPPPGPDDPCYDPRTIFSRTRMLDEVSGVANPRFRFGGGNQYVRAVGDRVYLAALSHGDNYVFAVLRREDLQHALMNLHQRTGRQVVGALLKEAAATATANIGAGTSVQMQTETIHRREVFQRMNWDGDC